jgi:hypothetical protein
VVLDLIKFNLSANQQIKLPALASKYIRQRILLIDAQHIDWPSTVYFDKTFTMTITAVESAEILYKI